MRLMLIRTATLPATRRLRTGAAALRVARVVFMVSSFRDIPPLRESVQQFHLIPTFVESPQTAMASANDSGAGS
jgi:hypothetical protein